MMPTAGRVAAWARTASTARWMSSYSVTAVNLSLPPPLRSPTLPAAAARRAFAGRGLQPLDLAQLAFQQQPEGRHVSVELAHRVFGPFPHQVFVQLGAVDDPGRLPMRVAHDHRGFLFRLDPQIRPELLRGNQRVVHRSLTLPVRPELVLRALEPFLGLHPARVSRSISSASRCLNSSTWARS